MSQTTFSMRSLLSRVARGKPVPSTEIYQMIENLDTVPDDQISAFLAHVYHAHLSKENMVDLTLAMRDSGNSLEWGEMDKPIVDKHSTGGVGDKVTICLGPLVAALGLGMPTISGRGLGHTGGTLDKLHAIPGFSCDLSREQIVSQVKKLGIAMAQQTDDVAPADRKLYAMRDVTATVMSVQLITASILAKKLSENLDSLTIDLKWGTGAFMKTLDNARELARSLIETAEGAGVKTRAVITNMNQPLGAVSGNWCESAEAVKVLKNDLSHPLIGETRELTLALAAQMLASVDGSVTEEQALVKATEALDSGKAYEVFCQVLECQGASPSLFDKDFDLTPECQHELVVKAPQSGYLQSLQTETLGEALVLARAGREKVTDQVDAQVSLFHPIKVGAKVAAGDELFRLRYNDATHAARFQSLLEGSFQISDAPVSEYPLIQEVQSL